MSLLSICTDIQKQFAPPPQSQRVELGGRAEIRCGAPRGLPTPAIAWLKNDQPLVSDAATLITAEGSVLITHASMQVRTLLDRHFSRIFNIHLNILSLFFFLYISKGHCQLHVCVREFGWQTLGRTGQCHRLW